MRATAQDHPGIHRKKCPAPKRQHQHKTDDERELRLLLGGLFALDRWFRHGVTDFFVA
ncbi:hypothetical protein [Rhodobacter xanthinilyticus]|uniref:hypothetical protein n=1 Tax=Rhodobacter xanthinilyticus TaxID=1850250 RepID=UPI001E4FB07D|nr:hypothetical protein [Rhodobacter xanthinilyticus]